MRCFDSFLQFIAAGCFQHKCRGSRPENQYRQAYIGMHRQNDELAAQTHRG